MDQLLDNSTDKMNNPQNIELKEYIAQSKLRLEKILKRLEWSEEKTLKDYNTNSIASSLKKVTKKPQPPAKATYPDSCITLNSLVLETSKLQDILQSNEVNAPCNFRELQENFSREQKLKIYEHVVKNTEKLENNTVEKQVEGEVPLADILAQKKREEKHKKRRFRKSKPTHIEEVRCLVNLQMEALQQFVENKTKKEKQSIFPGTSAKNDSQREGIRSRDERSRFEDYYRRERNFEKLTEQRKKRSNRSRSKERIRHKHKRQERSSSKELCHRRKRYTRSRSKERRKRQHRISSNEIRQEGVSSRKERSRSNERRGRKDIMNTPLKRKKHSRSRSSDRYKRSCSKEISKDSNKYSRTHGCESYTRREDDYERYLRKESRTSEVIQQSRRETAKNGDNEFKCTKTNSNLEKDKKWCEQYKHYQAPEVRSASSNSRISKHKNKEHKRS